MYSHTITVKGVGKVSARPDYVVISMNLEALDKKYDKAMELAARNIDSVTGVLVAASFAKDDIKTTNYNVNTRYDNQRDKDGNWHNIFKGYAVSHSLKLEFDFDSKRLGEALNAIASCEAKPQFSIAFTVKDPTAISEEMLRSAAENARRKAEVLCSASGTKLGDLLQISYNWGELNVFSETRYEMEDDCMPMMKCMGAAAVDFEPDDIDLSDTATFVWEMK